MIDDPSDKRDDEKFDGEIDPLYWIEAQFCLHPLPAHVWQAIDIMRRRDEDPRTYGCEYTVVVPR